jgi:hypothetical protein
MQLSQATSEGNISYFRLGVVNTPRRICRIDAKDSRHLQCRIDDLCQLLSGHQL